MKKLCLIFLVVMSIALSSCTELKTQQNSTGSDAISESENIFVVSSYEACYLLNAEQSGFGAAREYHESLSDEKEYEFMGKKYNLEYINSAQFKMSDLNVRVYKAKDIYTDRDYDVYFYFNIVDNSLVRVMNFPFQYDNFNDEKCIDIIKELVGNRMDLNEKKLTVTTTYRKIYDNGIEVKTVPGIYKCADESEDFGLYSFYYTLEKDGIQFEKRITADFREDFFTIEIIDNDCIENIDSSTAETVVKAFINEHLKEDYSISSIEVLGIEHRKFDGKDYLIVNTDVKYTNNRDLENNFYPCVLNFAVKLH